MLSSPTIVGSAWRAAEPAKDRALQPPKAFDRERFLTAIEPRLPETAPGRECVEHALEVRGVSLRFGGVRALTEVSFGVNDGELFSIIGPNGAGKTSIVNCISGRYRPTEGQLFYRGQDITALNPNARPRLGIGRTFQNLALFHHMSVLDNIMVGRHHLLKNNFITGSLYWLTGARREELEHRRKVEEIIDFLDLQAVRKGTAGTLPYGLRQQAARGHAALRRAQALRARPRQGAGAAADPARRADGRHELRGKGGHGPLHRRSQRRGRHDGHDDRARHGCGGGYLAPCDGAG